MPHLFDQKHNNSDRLWNIITIKNRYFFFLVNLFLNVIYSCGGKAEFSASLLQVSVSHIFQKTYYDDVLNNISYNYQC